MPVQLVTSIFSCVGLTVLEQLNDGSVTDAMDSFSKNRTNQFPFPSSLITLFNSTLLFVDFDHHAIPISNTACASTTQNTTLTLVRHCFLTSLSFLVGSRPIRSVLFQCSNCHHPSDWPTYITRSVDLAEPSHDLGSVDRFWQTNLRKQHEEDESLMVVE